MRFRTVVAVVFSACCCFSVLNLSFELTGQKSDQFYLTKRSLLNITLTDDEILRCQYFTDKIVRDLNQRPTEDIFEDILLQYSLFLQQKAELFESKNENGFIRTPQFENQSQEHVFIREERSAIETSKEVNSKNAGAYGISNGASVSKDNDDNSTSVPLSAKYESLQMSTGRIFKATTESPGLWRLLFGNKGAEEAEVASKDSNAHIYLKMISIDPTPTYPIQTAKSSRLWSLLFRNNGSSDHSSSVPATRENNGNAIELSTDEPENRKKGFDTMILSSKNSSWSIWNYLIRASGSSDNSRPVSATKQKGSNLIKKTIDKPGSQKTWINIVIQNSTNTNWRLWNYLFGDKDSKNSSNLIRSFENLVKGPITETNTYFKNSTDLEPLKNEITAIWNIVMPGTKWCGSGDVAANDDDLGYFQDVDRCCRAHDKCDDIMIPGESKYNLTNTSPFTVLNCKCDDELYNCLSQINSVASNTVGNTFFNIFGRMCYTLDYPRICKHSTILGCQEYVIDEEAEKVYQWKPAKKYLKTPFNISGR